MSSDYPFLSSVAAFGVSVLVAPFIALIVATPWSRLDLVPGDMQALWTSVKYTTVALLIIVALGTPVAYWLAHSVARGKLAVEALLVLVLLTPPLALGIILALFFGPYGLLGRPLAAWGLTFSNSAPAFVVAQVYAAMPYYVLAARAAFESVPEGLEELALTLGRSRGYAFRHVTLPLAGLGLSAALALAWVRAIGEFGVVLIIAYFPQGIPVKLWVNLQDYGLHSVYLLLWLFFAIAMPLPLLLSMIARRRRLPGI